MIHRHIVFLHKTNKEIENFIQKTHKWTKRECQTCHLFTASCPKLPVPAYGRRLGRVFAVGHEVYFVCMSGYKLIGPRSRVCLQTRRWSGQQPECRRTCPARILKLVWVLTSNIFFPHSGHNGTRASTTPSSSSIHTSSVSPSSSPPPSSPSIRPSRCSHHRGSTRCICPVGFTISGRNNNICTGGKYQRAE